MARTSGVWGIDIGQTALKALRCQPSDADDGTLEATAFDFIEYPKILSQPDSEPEKTVREALEQFLSRNKIKGDRIAVSVPGQAGLARFFKPPPVDKKKLPDIVKYEAKQQIPFPLEDVVWDWQQIGGMEVDGFALESEVGLFAMKREQVFKAIKPFTNARLELDVIQLSPLAIYNAVTHDLLQDAKGDFDPDDPPESFIVLSIGTETTDLVVTNGFRVWQRSLAIGGNHFTKQMTKELKLTFAKAEHIKRNARQAEDPKTIFQAMRPVFNDLVTEVQRSLGFYQNIDRKAKLGKIVLFGNTTKLPGLQQYLAKNLDIEVQDYQSFSRLQGASITAAPSFKDNLLSFGVCYGLCLQGSGMGKLRTNLLPREFITKRMIAAKKPWTLAGVSALMLACSFNFFFGYNVWYAVHPTRAEGDVTWQQVVSRVESAKSRSQAEKNNDAKALNELTLVKTLGDEVVGNSDRRLEWLEVLTAIQISLPKPTKYSLENPPDPIQVPFSQRPELHIEYVESEFFPELKDWFTEGVKQKYLEGKRETGGAVAAAAPPVAANQGAPGVPDPMAPPPQPGAPPVPGAPGTEPQIGPTGPGWVIELRGYHFFNADPRTSGSTHVLRNFIANLENGSVALAVANNRTESFTMKELGISYPTQVETGEINSFYTVPNPRYEPPAAAAPGAGGAGVGGPAAPPAGQAAAPRNETKQPEKLPAPRYDFTVQFCWQPKPLSKRLQERAETEKKNREAAKGTSAAAAPVNPVR